MKNNTFPLLSLCLVMLSCQEETVPSITLNQTEIAVSNGESFQVIHFESNVSWTAMSSESWCSIYPASGDASTKDITVTAATNVSYDDRSCTITIVAGDLSKKLTVNQNSSLGVLVTQDKYELSNEATTIEVEVKANVEFDVIISDDWISQITTRGLSSTKLNFDIAKNSSYDSRDGSITIKQKDGSLSSTIKVFQSQKDAIILSNKSENLSSDSQTLEVELKTNIDFEVIIPDAAKSWVSYLGTRALRTETLSLNIAVNEDYDPRSTEIYIKNKATNLQDTLTINQGAKSGLFVTQDIFYLNNEAATIEVEIKTNIEYDVIISDDWITKVTTRGLPSTKLNFNIARNKSYGKREGSITIKQKNGALTSSITIYQSQEDAIILSNKSENLSSDGQTLEVELKTNVYFEVIIPEAAKNWVSYTPTRALRTDTLSLNIAENKEYEGRSTEIYIKNKASNLQDTLTINQSAKLGLLVTQDIFYLDNEAATIEVEIKTNVEYDVIISDYWITKVTTRSLPSSKLNFNISKNNTYNKREGLISLKQKNGALTSTINVYQSQEDAIILSNRTANLSSESQTLMVELRANVDFEVIIPEAAKNWVSYTPTRALRTEILSLNITENRENDARTTKIYIRNRTTGIQDILTINQIGLNSFPKTYIGTRDIKTYVGASNFLIDKLLEAKPTAKFIFITHFTEDGVEGNGHLKTLINTQLKVAEYWGVQSVNLAETMDAVNKTGITNTLVKFATDGLHPAKSQNLWSVNKIAQQIASEINGIYGDWTGKRIAWYGTSIAAGTNLYTPESQYPLVIATLLGCTAINYSQVGAKIRKGTTNGSSVTTSFLDTSTLWNYQTSILDLIGTVNEPDLFVFDFGINDWYIDSTDFQNVGY